MAITLTASKNPATVGDDVTFTAAGDGTYTKYTFKKGTTTVQDTAAATFKITGAAESDSGSYTVVGTTADGTETSSAVSLVVNKKEVPVPEGGFAYIHPLPWRNSGFIQVGWWVINEIHRAGELGIDWKTAPDPLKYKKELLTLAKMFEDYDNVEVQESRNGYIFGKDQVEAGYIY
ncbi:hypothetical protein [Erwinia phage FBB1]|nr:hypothetical protein [Erwinia phage FBB1]